MKYKKILFSAILLAAFFVSFSGQAQTCEPPDFILENGLCFPANTGLSESTVEDVIISVLEWLLGIFGFLGILTFIASGIFYFTAAGDAEQEKKAKNAMKMGIIGIVIGLSGFVIIQAIDAALNAGTGF
jgi:hypothetical protein